MSIIRYDEDTLTQILSNFVKNVCKNRDETHGFNHMKTVYNNALIIMSHLPKITSRQRSLSIICAWLHDVNDHKYNNENEEVLNIFLDKYFSESKILIIEIIKRISFSFEKKYGRQNWLNDIGVDGLIVRNIVSDADKIDAINIHRCYLFEKMIIHPEVDTRDIWLRVIKHYNEKLLLLKDYYLHNKISKTIAQPLHEKMIIEVNEIKNRYNII